MKILVADDQIANRSMMQMLLKALNHTVAVVNDGAQACAAVEAEPFDLVLMDLHMPVMDGLEAISIIRARPGVPPRLVVVTADHSPESLALCLAVGADAVATKPIDIAKLKSIIAESQQPPPAA